MFPEKWASIVSLSIEKVVELCHELGIPEYTEYLDDEDIIILALGKMKLWLKENRDDLYDDIHEGEEVEPDISHGFHVDDLDSDDEQLIGVEEE